MDVSDEAIERLRVTQPGADATLLRARVCKQCGRIDWYVDPKKVGELA